MRREANTDLQPLARARSDTTDRIVATTVGDEHACALSSRNRAYCWGGDRSLTATPDTMAGATLVPGNHRFRSIAAGASFTCAVDTDGRAFCWGRGQKGQLGAGAFFDASDEPQGVAGEHRFTSLVAGREHVCALDDAGDAWCWGDNAHGQLGDRTRDYASIPTRVLGGQKFQVLGAGAESNTTCGVSFLGEGFCWGDNSSGQLGDGSTRSSAIPVRVKALSNLRFVDPGADATCALHHSGAVYCWGGNALGQVGVGYAIRDSLIATPARLRVSEKFLAVASGDQRACAVSVAGATYCWGSAADASLRASADDSCTERRISCTRNPVLVRGGTLTQVALGPHARGCGASRTPAAVAAYCWGRKFSAASTAHQ